MQCFGSGMVILLLLLLLYLVSDHTINKQSTFRKLKFRIMCEMCRLIYSVFPNITWKLDSWANRKKWMDDVLAYTKFVPHCPRYIYDYLFIFCSINDRFHIYKKFLENSRMSYVMKGLMMIRWTRLSPHYKWNDEKFNRPRIVRRTYWIPNRLFDPAGGNAIDLKNENVCHHTINKINYCDMIFEVSFLNVDTWILFRTHYKHCVRQWNQSNFEVSMNFRNLVVSWYLHPCSLWILVEEKKITIFWRWQMIRAWMFFGLDSLPPFLQFILQSCSILRT